MKDYDKSSYRTAALTSDYAPAQATCSFMNRVYLLMGAGLALTAIVAFFVAGSPGLVKMFLGNNVMFWCMIIVEFGLVVWLSSCIEKMSAATATAGFIAYAVVNGVTMSVIFLAFTISSIAVTFLITAGGFAGLSLFGFLTKRNLGAVGTFCLYALFGLIIASIVNIFLKSNALDWAVSIFGIIIFSGLTAYDTQKLKEIGNTALEREALGKYAVIGALNLYLDFINLFLFLLRLFGNRR